MNPAGTATRPSSGADPGSLSYSVGGVSFHLQTSLVIRRDERREVFRVPTGEPEVVIRVREGELGEDPPGSLVFDSGMVWRAYESDGDRVFRFHSPVLGRVPYKELRISGDYRQGEIVLHRGYLSGDPVDPLEYPLDELLVVHRLGAGLGCELHALGITDGDGRGWILCGHSGAGKSTLARLVDGGGFTVLSDDRIIVRQEAGGAVMFGTPWHGEAGLAVAASAPLAGILVLAHGTANRIVELSRMEGLSELMARAFVPFHDDGAVGTALETLNGALDTVPCARFEFVPDASAVASLVAWMTEPGQE